MFGAKALTIPFARFSGSFAYIGEGAGNDFQQNSAQELQKFADWVAAEAVAAQMNRPIDLTRLTRDLQQGLYFQSDVPLQYGVGSSGALCAALYSRYCLAGQELQPSEADIRAYRSDFKILESYFHGRSSGLDPLVSLLNRPLLVEGDQISLPDLDLNELGCSVWLIDTAITSPTSPLVQRFVKRMEEEAFAELFRSDYLPLNDGAIAAFIAHEPEAFLAKIDALSSFQFNHFQEMIPESLRSELWAMRSQGFFVKLLGSGGGGFLLAFGPKETDLVSTKKSFRIF